MTQQFQQALRNRRSAFAPRMAAVDPKLLDNPWARKVVLDD